MTFRFRLSSMLNFALCGLSAQDTRGEIVGRVVDPAGAVFAGTAVSATSFDAKQDSPLLENQGFSRITSHQA